VKDDFLDRGVDLGVGQHHGCFPWDPVSV
jgi:hypothetical protein